MTSHCLFELCGKYCANFSCFSTLLLVNCPKIWVFLFNQSKSAIALKSIFKLYFLGNYCNWIYYHCQRKKQEVINDISSAVITKVIIVWFNCLLWPFNKTVLLLFSYMFYSHYWKLSLRSEKPYLDCCTVRVTWLLFNGLQSTLKTLRNS